MKDMFPVKIDKIIRKRLFCLKSPLAFKQKEYLLAPFKLFSVISLLDKYLDVLRKRLKVFPTFNLRDMNPRDSYLNFPSSEYLMMRNDIGIVMQGPIRHKSDFTYLAIYRYLHYYPGLHIVLSTWEGEELSKFKTLQTRFPNFHILVNLKPEHAGTQNINFQIISTNAGLKKIDSLGLAFAIKTRTDQCFFDPFAIDKLREIYRLHNSEPNSNRIVFLSQNSFILRLYGPSDMFQFGATKQIQLYWDSPLEKREREMNQNLYRSLTMREFCREEVCEVYICSNYLRKLKIELDYTLKQHFEVFRDYFIILDSTSLDLVWDKYTYNSSRWNQTSNSIFTQEWSYGYWLAISKILERKLDLEPTLDLLIISE